MTDEEKQAEVERAVRVTRERGPIESSRDYMTTPTDAEIAAIRERRKSYTWTSINGQSLEDFDTMLAAVDAQKAENKNQLVVIKNQEAVIEALTSKVLIMKRALAMILDRGEDHWSNSLAREALEKS